MSKDDITSKQSADATTFDWTAFIARAQGERDGWRELFSVTGTVDASRTQVRQAFADIFSGGTGAAQRAHLLAIARRLATVVERVLASGTGSTASPATMSFEGAIGYQDVMAARRS